MHRRDIADTLGLEAVRRHMFTPYDEDGFRFSVFGFRIKKKQDAYFRGPKLRLRTGRNISRKGAKKAKEIFQVPYLSLGTV